MEEEYNYKAKLRAVLLRPYGYGYGYGQPAGGTRRLELDPRAREWNPRTERAPEEARCLFLTFSNGYPLTDQQILTFFTSKYGECVERVYVHSADNGNQVPALFAKVVFNASYVPALILGGGTHSKFTVDGRPLWCKKFDPNKKNKKKTTTSTSTSHI